MVRLDPAQVYVTDVDSQAVVLDATASTYLTANPAGTLLLTALQDETSLPRLVELVTTTFDVDESTAARDCESFLAELGERGWLLADEVGPAPSA